MPDKHIEIRKGIVVLDAEHDSNITCIELDDELIFVDAGTRDDVAKNFRKEMEKRFKKKTSHLILTHYHWDHIGGMASFSDVEIVGAKSGLEEYKQNLEGELSDAQRIASVEQNKENVKKGIWNETERTKIFYKYYPKMKLLLPSKTVENELIIGSGKRDVIIKEIGGHTKCSLYVYIPSEKTIIVGDNLASDTSQLGQCFFRSISKNTIEILNELEKLDYDIVIPGHGPVVNKHYLTNSKNYLSELFLALEKIARDEVKPCNLKIDHSYLPTFFDGNLPDCWNIVLKRLYVSVALEIFGKEIDKKKEAMIKAIIEGDRDFLINTRTTDLEDMYLNGSFIQGLDDYSNQVFFWRIHDGRFENIDRYFFGNKIVEKCYYCYRRSIDSEEYRREYIYFWKKVDDDWKLSSQIRLS
ncbi:MAG: MBL fold metallo-hydrolase [Asgard group archaeon]|nr:MBL fold metallo-hydrolase [Asgard group archaeon]